MITLILCFVFFLLASEIAIHAVFFIISKLIGKPHRNEINKTTVFKGLLERTFVVMCLYFDVVQSITFLGALKVATRIKDNENKVSNDFFLIGNLISVMSGIAYYVALKFLLKDLHCIRG